MQTDLLALDLACIACHEPRPAQFGLQRRVIVDQCARDAVSHRTRLTGFAPAVDIDVLAVAVSRFSVLAAHLADRVREIDVNPLVCGREIAAVDALFVKD